MKTKTFTFRGKPDWFIYLHQAGLVVTLFLLVLLAIGFICVSAGLGGWAVMHYHFTP